MSDEPDVAAHTRAGAHDHVGIEIVRASAELVELRLEVGPHVHTPIGLLHGGVSALLAEGAASIGGGLSVGEGEVVVGTELNCSHLRAMREGTLRAVATPVRKGRRVQVWSIELRDDRERLISVARCSLQVIAAPAPPESAP